MSSVLLVEDEAAKREQISRVLTDAGLRIEDIDMASDVNAARRMLARKRYTLLILDINIPLRADLPPAPGGGLEIIRALESPVSRLIRPGFIVGVTAYEDAKKAANATFEETLWKIVDYSPFEDHWKRALTGALKEVNRRHGPPFPSDGSSYYTDLLVFAALDEEIAPVLQWKCNWQKHAVPNDPQQYWRGELKGAQTSRTVVATVAPRMGLPTAAVAATKAIAAFRPAVVAVVGICAGFRDRTHMGDILVPDVCWDWGSGKWVERPGQAPLFRAAPYQWHLDADLRSLMATPEFTQPIINRIHLEYDGAKPAVVPAVRVNATASGASVLQSQGHMNAVADQHKNVLGIDMETYSVFTAAEMADSPRPRCVSLKAVCDFGDGAKNDDYHAYAASLSAAFLEAVADRLLGD